MTGTRRGTGWTSLSLFEQEDPKMSWKRELQQAVFFNKMAEMERILARPGKMNGCQVGMS